MSNQVYRNPISKYSPSKLVNKMQLTGANQAVSASYVPKGIIWNKINGVTAVPAGGIIDYSGLILPGTDSILPIYVATVQPYTYFQVNRSGTYTFNVQFAMQGFTVTNEYRAVGFGIYEVGSATLNPIIKNNTSQWSTSSGAVDPGNMVQYSSYTAYLEAGSVIVPAVMSSNGVNVIADASGTQLQYCNLEYFEN